MSDHIPREAASGDTNTYSPASLRQHSLSPAHPCPPVVCPPANPVAPPPSCDPPPPGLPSHLDEVPTPLLSSITPSPSVPRAATSHLRACQTQSAHLPQGLCTGSSHCFHAFPRFSHSGLPASFGSLLKCHILTAFRRPGPSLSLSISQPRFVFLSNIYQPAITSLCLVFVCPPRADWQHRES